MKHARADYQRIQDPEGKIPEDEPVFLLRGQDRSAPDAVEEYARQHLSNGGDPTIAMAAMQQAEAMRAWQDQHGSKVADLPAAPSAS